MLIYLLGYINIDIIEGIATITGDGIISRANITSIPYTTITQIIVKYGPTGFEKGALNGCTSLKYLDLSLSVRDIDGATFSKCPALTRITVPDENPSISCDSQGALYNADKTILMRCPAVLTQFIIPETVVSIQGGCFRSMKSLSKLNIPSSVKFFETSPFNEMYNMEMLTFSPGSKMTSINKSTFFYCSVKELHVPPSIERFDDQAFFWGGVSKLVFDNFDESNLSYIGLRCFENNYFTSFELPSKVNSLPDYCFGSCSSLKSVTIPSQCEKISQTAFYLCVSLSNITVSSDNQNFISVDGALFNYNKTIIYCLPNGITSITIPPELETIGLTALQSSSNLMDIIILNNSRYASEDGVLYNHNMTKIIAICGGRTSITIKSHVEIIGESAFSSSRVATVHFESFNHSLIIHESAFAACNSLLRVDFPRELKGIGAMLFMNCKGINTVTFDPDCDLESLSTNCFTSSSIKTAVLHKNINTLSYRAFYSCTSLSNLTFLEGSRLRTIDSATFSQCTSLQIYGSFPSLVSINTYAFQNCKSLNFPFETCDNLLTISQNAFEDCGTKSIFFRSSINSIGTSSFVNNVLLTAVIFDEDAPITYISSSAFINCGLLSKVVLPKGFQTLDYSIFSGCISLTDIDCDACDNFADYRGIVYSRNADKLVLCAPGITNAIVNDSIVEILDNAFCDSRISQIDFSLCNKLTTIRSNTFLNCEYLTVAFLPKSLTSLGVKAFSGCSSLSSLPFHPETKPFTITSYCFQNCGFQTLNVPPFVTQLDEFCFAGCASLKSVQIGANFELIKDGCFSDCPSLNSIFYCGFSDIAEGTPFDPSAIVLVSAFYPKNTFGGSIVDKALDPSCYLITSSFSASVSSTLISQTASVMSDNE